MTSLLFPIPPKPIDKSLINLKDPSLTETEKFLLEGVLESDRRREEARKCDEARERVQMEKFRLENDQKRVDRRNETRKLNAEFKKLREQRRKLRAKNHIR